MTIYLWVRRTLDWADETAFLEQIDDRDRPGIEAWNATFAMPFHRFRLRVREIAAHNHASLRGVAQAEWDDIPQGALVLPVDDDDWFAPEIARFLDPDAIGHRWPNTWVQVPLNLRHRLRLLGHRWLGTPLKFFCGTNNYALVKRPDNRKLLSNHSAASEWFEPRLREPNGGGIRLLDERLSVANRTLGSATVLRQTDRPEQLLRRFQAYMRLYCRDPGAELAWARPYVAKMAALMDELEPPTRSGRTRGPRR
jgi:hypothetical protein